MAYYLLFIVFSNVLRTSFTMGCWEHDCVLLFQRYAIVLAACVPRSWVMLLLPFGCGGVLGTDGACLFRFLFLICGAFLLCVCVCLCVLNVCAARHVVLLWVRWCFMGPDGNYGLQLCRFFKLACFCLWCHLRLLSCWMRSEVMLVSFGFWFVTSSKAFHNAVWLWVMLYKFFRWSPCWWFTAGFTF